METIYLIIVVFLLILAIFDLFVGVSNDAVNFLNSAIGARVASFRTILIVTSFGVALGAIMSAGMMDVARHGIMQPSNYSFHEVMVLFLAVMVTDILVLDMFNTLGMPTSTTVSLVFELLGGAFVVALIKIGQNPSTVLLDYLNADKALSVIIAIFMSVAVAFVCGIAVQWLARLFFTFGYKGNHYFITILFGGISLTILMYFIFIKGLSSSVLIDENVKMWILNYKKLLVVGIFIISVLISCILLLFRVSLFKIVVLVGTFALAMAFAGNDLVNFIGVPLAGLSSYQDFTAHGTGDAYGFKMVSLMNSARSPFIYLLISGIIMIVAITTSKKSKNVVKTSVDLSRQDESEEMFGSSRAARSIVRAVQDGNDFISRFVPRRITAFIDKRFNKEDAVPINGAAFDEVRAAINLVLSSIIIIAGTMYKLPLSTTYVTFMVAMGTSLADRAWSRESAVFRVTGVFSVIGGWFITAGVSFVLCALVCLAMYYGGFAVMFLLMAVVIFLLIRSNIRYKRKMNKEGQDKTFQLMRTKDPELVWIMLRKHFGESQIAVCRFVLMQYERIINGLTKENIKDLRVVQKELKAEQELLQKLRRREFLSLRRIPRDVAIERNTWFHLGKNSDQQFVYCLKRMLEPIKEHVDNNFNPLPIRYQKEFEPMRRKINRIIENTITMFEKNSFNGYKDLVADTYSCKNDLSIVRKNLIDSMQHSDKVSDYKISLVYLNLLQESQELLSILRHQIRATQKFLE